MVQKSLVVQIAGNSGDGAISAGDIFSLASARCGLNVTTHKVYPAEIRGSGSTMFHVRISAKKIYTHGEEANILVALSNQAIELNWQNLKKDGMLIYEQDGTAEELLKEIPSTIKKIAVPFIELSKEVNNPKSKNIIALGVLAGLFPQIKYEEQLKLDIENKFKNKGEEVLNANIQALELGLQYSKDNLSSNTVKVPGLTPNPTGKLVMTGNEAIAFGSLVAGCRFYAGYPITPATDIMEWIAYEMPKLGGSVIQAEDEIAAVVQTIGASYAGARSMTATSGPGLSLMSEALGLAAMAEIPLVIINVQRGGPSTGIPTKPEQSDLNQAVFGTHGDCPKMVIAPIDVEDCFYQVINAFNLAEKYQLPIIVLSDAYLGQKRESVNAIDLSKIERMQRERYQQIDKNVPYLRYNITQTGVSSMSEPSVPGGMYVATGLEHNELSNPSYSPEVHKAMTEKRFRKLKYARNDFHKIKTYGDPNAKVGVITWGSSAPPTLEAADLANSAGCPVHVMYPKILYPLHEEWVNDFAANKETLLFVERNYVGQLSNHMLSILDTRRQFKAIRHTKYDCENFTPSEIFSKIQELYEEE